MVGVLAEERGEEAEVGGKGGCCKCAWTGACVASVGTVFWEKQRAQDVGGIEDSRLDSVSSLHGHRES